MKGIQDYVGDALPAEDRHDIKDLVLKDLLDNDARFASLLNTYLFTTDAYLSESSLEPWPTEIIGFPLGKEIHLYRDMVRIGRLKSGQRAILVIVGIENQSTYSKADVLRFLMYEVLIMWLRQKMIEHKLKLLKMGPDETEEQFEIRKRQLESVLPVRTLVFYTGSTPWAEEAKKLRSLYGENEPEDEDKTAVDNYEINVIDMRHSTELPDDPCMATFMTLLRRLRELSESEPHELTEQLLEVMESAASEDDIRQAVSAAFRWEREDGKSLRRGVLHRDGEI